MTEDLEMVAWQPGMPEQDELSAEMQRRLEAEGGTVKEVDDDARRVLLVMADGTEVWIAQRFVKRRVKQ